MDVLLAAGQLLLLAGAIALLRRLTPRPAPAPAWHPLVDPALAALLAVGLGLFWAHWFSRFHLVGDRLTSADFQIYCGSMTTLRDGQGEFWFQARSVASGWLPVLLASRTGIVDGLLYGSLLSGMAIAGALYLWGRALHGRLAGIASALSASAVAPLVLTTRHLSFYPEIIAGMCLCAAGTALAVRRRTLPALVTATAGAGIALLVDSRGLIWALPALGTTVLVACLAPRRSIPWRLGAVGLVLVLAWFAGRPAYAPTDPLEIQLALSARDVAAGTDVLEVDEHAGGYRWGYSNPLTIPKTLLFLARASKSSQAILSEDPANLEVRRQHVAPWLPLAGLALLGAVVGLRRRPLLLLGLAASVVPFLVSLRAATHWESSLRYLGLALPFVPLLMGLAFATLVEGALPREDPSSSDPSGVRERLLGAIRPLLAVALLLGLVFGLPPSWLSPTASWRVPWDATPEARQTVHFVATGEERPTSPLNQACVNGLQRDVSLGLDPERAFRGSGDSDAEPSQVEPRERPR